MTSYSLMMLDGINSGLLRGHGGNRLGTEVRECEAAWSSFSPSPAACKGFYFEVGWYRSKYIWAFPDLHDVGTASLHASIPLH